MELKNREDLSLAFYPTFESRWNNAEKCKICNQLGMPSFQETSTARRCACCGWIEERL
jgi:hypothetical protein